MKKIAFLASSRARIIKTKYYGMGIYDIGEGLSRDKRQKK
jgi:hypothetical protein